MDAAAVLKEAWRAVDSAELPDHIQAIAFQEAIRLLAGGDAVTLTSTSTPRSAGLSERGPADGSDSSRRPPTSDGVESSESSFFSKFAEESGVSEDKLRALYYLKESEVRLSVSRRRLGESEADKNRTVATLVAAAAYYVNGTQQVSLKAIREAAVSLGYTPSRNLSAQLATLSGLQAVGVGSDRALRVQSSRFDAPFLELVDRLTV